MESLQSIITLRPTGWTPPPIANSVLNRRRTHFFCLGLGPSVSNVIYKGISRMRQTSLSDQYLVPNFHFLMKRIMDIIEISSKHLLSCYGGQNGKQRNIVNTKRQQKKSKITRVIAVTSQRGALGYQKGNTLPPPWPRPPLEASGWNVTPSYTTTAAMSSSRSQRLMWHSSQRRWPPSVWSTKNSSLIW